MTLMRSMAFTVSPMMDSPIVAASLALSELLAADVQFLAISADVLDISSLAVATELTCWAACSTPSVIRLLAPSSVKAVPETRAPLPANWVTDPAACREKRSALH